MTGGRLLSGLGLLMITAAPLRAHDAQLSAIRVLRHTGSARGEVVVSVSMHLSRLAWAEGERSLEREAAERALRKRLRLRFGGVPFAPREVSLIFDRVNDQVVWQGRGPLPPGALSVPARLIPEDAGASTLVAVMEDGQAVREELLDAGHPSLASAPGQAQESAGPGRASSALAALGREAWIVSLCALAGGVALARIRRERGRRGAGW